MKKQMAFTILITISSVLLGVYKLLWIVRIINWIVISSTIAVACIIWYKLKGFYYDNLHIRRELLYTVQVGAIFISIGIVVPLLFFFEIYDELVYTLILRYIIFIYCNLSLILLILVPKRLIFAADYGNGCCHCLNCNYDCCCCHVCDGLFLCQFFHDYRESRKSGFTMKQTMTQMHIAHASKSSKTLDNFGSKWSDVVCTLFGYESLIQHLQKEFSIENLLFITEVCVCMYTSKQRVMHEYFLAFFFFGLLSLMLKVKKKNKKTSEKKSVVVATLDLSH